MSTNLGAIHNDTDADASDTLTVSAVNGTGPVGSQITLPSGALVTVNADGSYDYDPNGAFEGLAVGETGTDTFTYTITDGNGGTDTATMTLTVNGVNDAPVAGADTTSTDEDTSISVGAAAGLIDPNDTDADASDTLTVSAVNGTGPVGSQITLPSGALLTVNADGSYDYDPNGAFEGLAVGETGTDTFTYTITDGNGGTDTATMMLTANGVNDAPVAGALPDVTGEDSAAINIATAQAFSDGDGDTLVFSANGLPGGLAIDPVTGEISGVIAPYSSNNGPFTVTVIADDNNGGTVSSTFQLAVLPTALPLPPVSDGGGEGAVASGSGQGGGQQGEAGATIVLDVVNSLDDLGGTTGFDQNIVWTMVQGISEINDIPAGFGDDQTIGDLVAWIANQGDGWMDELVSHPDYRFFQGQNLDVSFKIVGGAEDTGVELKTLVLDDVVFLDISSQGANDFVDKLEILGGQGQVLAGNLWNIGNGVVAINNVAGTDWADLRLQYRGEDGKVEYRDIRVNVRSGEIISGATGSADNTLLFNDQLRQFGQARQAELDQLIRALDG